MSRLRGPIGQKAGKTGGSQAALSDAQAIAVEALQFIAGESETLDRFLSASGLDLAGLRDAAASPHFLGGVLDHVCADEPLLLAFADAQRRKPESVDAARRLLAGPSFEDPGEWQP